MKILRLLLVAVIATAVLCGCGETPARNDAYSDTASADVSSVGVSADSTSSSEITFAEDYGVDKHVLQKAFYEFQPKGNRISDNEIKILRRGFETEVFIGDMQSEGFELNYLKENGRFIDSPDSEDMEESGYYEVEPFDVKIGDKTYSVKTLSDLKAFVYDVLSQEYIKENDIEKDFFDYKKNEDGTYNICIFIEDDGKLFAFAPRAAGNLMYFMNPMYSEAVVTKSAKDSYVFALPCIQNIHSDADELQWFEVEMISENGIWKLNTLDWLESISF